jgi:bacterioferritin (cytochrome b1)
MAGCPSTSSSTTSPLAQNDDPTTRRMIEDILKMEEEHADDLASLLATLGKG